MELYEEEGSMSAMQQITFDFASDVPTIPDIELEPGNGIQWNFDGVPAGAIPFIQFATGFGPFQCIQTFANNVVQGKGNIGTNGESFSYTALLLDSNGTQGASRTGIVNSPTQTANTSPVVVVSFDAGPPATLTPVPPNLLLSVGDTALWHVLNLPEDHFVSFLFTSPLDSGTLLQPFSSLLMNGPTEGESPGILRIIGDAFAPGNVSTFTYQIAARDSTGAIKAQTDPQIDNLGQPGPQPVDDGDS